jgi:hypothetical protein
MSLNLRSGFSPNLSSASEQPSTVTMNSDGSTGTSSGVTVPLQNGGTTQYIRTSGVMHVAAPSRVVHQHIPEFSRRDPHIDLGGSEGSEVV